MKSKIEHKFFFILVVLGVVNTGFAVTQNYECKSYGKWGDAHICASVSYEDGLIVLDKPTVDGHRVRSKRKFIKHICEAFGGNPRSSTVVLPTALDRVKEDGPMVQVFNEDNEFIGYAPGERKGDAPTTLRRVAHDSYDIKDATALFYSASGAEEFANGIGILKRPIVYLFSKRIVEKVYCESK